LRTVRRMASRQCFKCGGRSRRTAAARRACGRWTASGRGA